ncbi:hypothetical protein KO465_03535 [Candidatus Micrarchaeota archaeon]|jgi:large subunit ribosomal protein L34e|nr:hypothetical protein [Candidatus Micrarchaeota archaeon]
MTKPLNRSTSKTKKFVRTPGGKTIVRYAARNKTKKHYSAISHEPLRGVSSDSKLSKSQRVPNRKYAGHLSPSELRVILKFSNRVKLGMMKIDDVDIKYKKYVEAQLKE